MGDHVTCLNPGSEATAIVEFTSSWFQDGADPSFLIIVRTRHYCGDWAHEGQELTLRESDLAVLEPQRELIT